MAKRFQWQAMQQHRCKVAMVRTTGSPKEPGRIWRVSPAKIEVKSVGRNVARETPSATVSVQSAVAVVAVQSVANALIGARVALTVHLTAKPMASSLSSVNPGNRASLVNHARAATTIAQKAAVNVDPSEQPERQTALTVSAWQTVQTKAMLMET
jgi:hypothetical protein